MKTRSWSGGRRTYFDHEPVYRMLLRTGARAWDDYLAGGVTEASYGAAKEFLEAGLLPPPERGARVLDLGCGGGQVAFLFAARGYSVVGVDYAESAVALARKNAAELQEPPEFIRANCLDLIEFTDSSFDAVLDNHVWHCIVGEADRQRFIREVVRVLRPGGLYFSESMTREGDFDPSRMDADPETFIARSHTRYWATSAELRRACQDAGLMIEHDTKRSKPEDPGLGEALVLYARKL